MLTALQTHVLAVLAEAPRSPLELRRVVRARASTREHVVTFLDVADAIDALAADGRVEVVHSRTAWRDSVYRLPVEKPHTSEHAAEQLRTGT